MVAGDYNFVKAVIKSRVKKPASQFLRIFVALNHKL